MEDGWGQIERKIQEVGEKGISSKGLEKEGWISLWRKGKHRWKKIQKWEGGKEECAMTDVTSPVVWGRWQGLEIYHNKDHVLSRQESRMSTGKAGGLGRLWIIRDPFGISWEFYEELIENQQEMTKGCQAAGQTPVKLGTFSSNAQKSREQGGELDWDWISWHARPDVFFETNLHNK